MFRTGICLFITLFTSILAAQPPDDVRFGRISAAERQLMTVPGDTSATAYVLYDQLQLDFEYNDHDGPVRVETFHRRVKLLTPASFDRANVELTANRNYQTIYELDAAVHLPDGGSVPLRSGDFIREKRPGNYETVKFTFPRVVPGAIIEYTYKQRTNSILTPTPYIFQEGIPVRWAEYRAMLPVYYKYVSLGSAGNYAVNEVKQVRRKWGPSFSSGPYEQSGGVPHTDIRWAMQNLPALRPQPYTNNVQDYVPKVRLQLQTVEYPVGGPKPVFSNWKETVNELQSRQDFGKYYRVKVNYNEVWKRAQERIEAAPTPREKINAAYYFVAGAVRWNGDLGWLATVPPDRVLANGSGNSADLNMMLLALLNEAGITAYPLLVSLRDRGAPIEVYPILDQFNHLMVYTEVDGRPYLLDANGPARPPGLPRVDALNHRGWVADRDNPRWVNLEVPRADQIILADLVVGEDGMAEFDAKSRMQSYFGFDGRARLHGMDSPRKAPLAVAVIEQFPAAEVISQEVTGGKDNANEPLALHLRMRVPAAQVSNDYLYVRPVLVPMLDRALDDVESRVYPIDFPYPWQKRYIVNVRVPAGYVVEELPESLRIVAEDEGMSATFGVEEKPGDLVSLVFTVQLDRTVYPAGDYPGLREMFRQIIDLQDAVLVYKRAK